MAPTRALLIGSPSILSETFNRLPSSMIGRAMHGCLLVGSLCTDRTPISNPPLPVYTDWGQAMQQTHADLCLCLDPLPPSPDWIRHNSLERMEVLGANTSWCLLNGMIHAVVQERREKQWHHFTQNLIDAVPSALIVFDVHGRAVYWNAAGEELTGRKKRDLQGETSLGTTFYPHERPLLGQRILHTLDPEELRPFYPEGTEILPISDGVRLRGHLSTFKEGLQGYYEVAAQRLRAGEQLLGAVELIHDRTSLRQLHETIGHQEEQLQSLIVNVPVPLVQTDPDGTILLCNPSAAQLFEAPGTTLPLPLKGRNLFDLLPDLYDQLPLGQDHRPLLPQTSEELSGTITYFWNQEEWEISYFVLKEGADVSEIIWTWRNVTTKEEENRLQAALAVAGAISHELAQPLTAIINSAQLLESATIAPNERAKRHAAIIHRESERVFELYRKLQNINRYKLKEYLDTQIFDLDGSAQPLTIPSHEE
ncbi:MAG: PAS domain-containing protein [Thermodesulfobacteriota bacterium]